MSLSFITSNNSKVYLDKPYVKVLWSPDEGILMNQWSGFSTFEEIKAVGDRILDAVVFEGAKKVLYDARELEVLDDESQKYISGSFASQMISAGVKFAATVFPDDILAQFSVNDIQKKMHLYKSQDIFYFNSFETAFEWLKKRKV